MNYIALYPSCWNEVKWIIDKEVVLIVNTLELPDFVQDFLRIRQISNIKMLSDLEQTEIDSIISLDNTSNTDVFDIEIEENTDKITTKQFNLEKAFRLSWDDYSIENNDFDLYIECSLENLQSTITSYKDFISSDEGKNLTNIGYAIKLILWKDLDIFLNNEYQQLISDNANYIIRPYFKDKDKYKSIVSWCPDIVDELYMNSF